MIKGDKIKLVSKMGVFDNIGEVCEVTDIQDGGVICFKFGNGRHLGCMSYDEFEKYFELVTAEDKIKPKHEWTEWKDDYVYFESINEEDVGTSYQYRHNYKKVQVRCFLDDGIVLKAEACCHNTDTFDLTEGLNLAEKRLIVKYMDYLVKELAKSM